MCCPSKHSNLFCKEPCQNRALFEKRPSDFGSLRTFGVQRCVEIVNDQISFGKEPCQNRVLFQKGPSNCGTLRAYGVQQCVASETTRSLLEKNPTKIGLFLTRNLAILGVSKEPYQTRALSKKRPSNCGSERIVASCKAQRCVDFLKDRISSAKEPYQTRALSQKRPSNCGSERIVASCKAQ